MTSPAEPNRSYFVTDAVSSRKSRTLKMSASQFVTIPICGENSGCEESAADIPLWVRPVRLLQAVSVQHACLGMTCFQTALILFPFLSLFVMIDDNAHDFVKLLLPKAMSKSIILK